MATQGTKNDRQILPDPTVAGKTATWNADLLHYEGTAEYQAIAGATLTLYQAIYLAAYTRGAITATPSTSGGALADGNYKAIIAANIPFGPNIASVGISTYGFYLATTEVSFTISGGGGAGSCVLSWAAVNGAVPIGGVTYQVWVTPLSGGAGSENYFFTTTGTTFTVTSVASGGTSGTVPTQVMPAQWQNATDTVPASPDEIFICVLAGAAGAVCYGRAHGTITNPAWNWTPNGAIYVPASAGALTQSAPTGSSVAIGKAGSPTEFIFLTGSRGVVSVAGVSSVSNSDGTLTISPTTGAVVASLATPVALAKGGTAANLTAAAGGAVYSTGSALAITAAGVSGQVLTSNGASPPTWQAGSSGGPTVIATANAVSFASGTSGSESTIATATLTGGTLGNNGLLHYVLEFTSTATTGTVTINFYLGATVVWSHAYGEGTSINAIHYDCWLANQGAQNAQRGIGNFDLFTGVTAGTWSAATRGINYNTAAIDTSTNQTVKITVTTSSTQAVYFPYARIEAWP